MAEECRIENDQASRSGESVVPTFGLNLSLVIRASPFTALRRASHQKSAAAHYLLAVEPDIEIASHAVDVRRGNPIRASMLRVRMSERDMHARNLFILQDVTN